MAKDVSANDYWNGQGEIWVNGLCIDTCSKAEIKKKNKYQEVPMPIGLGTKRIIVGYTIDVSFTYQKTSDEVDFSSDDIELIVTTKNTNGTKSDRVKAVGITFDEETLASFERGKVQEITMSGQAERYQKL